MVGLSILTGEGHHHISRCGYSSGDVGELISRLPRLGGPVAICIGFFAYIRLSFV